MNRTRSVDRRRRVGGRLPRAVGPVLLLCLLLWASTPAAAHFLNHHDRDDSEDSLDLRAVHLWEYPQERPLLAGRPDLRPDQAGRTRSVHRLVRQLRRWALGLRAR